MSDLVSIVIPVYNEHENIAQALTRIVAEVRIPYRLSLVYDTDKDTTLPVARETAEKLGIHLELVKNKYGRGALQAIKTGLHSAQGKYVVVTMADLSDPPSVINSMYEKAEAEKSDIICGSRYMKGGSQNGGPFFKGLLSKTAGLTLYYLAGLPTHDGTNSFKLYRKSLIDRVEIESQGGFELGLEIVVKAFAMGLKIDEVPTSWSDRSGGESRFRLFKWLPSYLRWYFFGYSAGFKRLFKKQS
jgi:dolichol-phosphate mannosyltransferase